MSNGKKKRRKHSAEFKARVGIEAVRGVKTVAEIAKEFDVHPVQVSQWKAQLLEQLPSVFEKGPDHDAEAAKKREEKLHRKVGQLTMEVDFLKNACEKLNIPLDGKR